LLFSLSLSLFQKSERDHGRAFGEELVEVVANLLRLFDSITLTSEVIPGSTSHSCVTRLSCDESCII